MELPTDSDLALAMAIAENSSSSQDDDFQHSSHADQLLVLKRFAGTHQSKRQKKDDHMSKKALPDKAEHVGKRGKENQCARRDGCKSLKLKPGNPNCSQIRRPLEDKQQNQKEKTLDGSPKPLADKNQKQTGETLILSLKVLADKKQTQAGVTLKSSPRPLAADETLKSLPKPLTDKQQRQGDEILKSSLRLLVDRQQKQTDEAPNRLPRSLEDWQPKQMEETLKCTPRPSNATVSSQPYYPACRGGNILPVNSVEGILMRETLPLEQQLEDVVSLAEEDDPVENVIQQKGQQLEPECMQSRKLHVNECLPSANVRPESQFSALLRLCVDAASEDGEENEAHDGSLAISFAEEGGSPEVEEAITSLMTQTKCAEIEEFHNTLLLDHAAELTTLEALPKSHEDNVPTCQVASQETCLAAQGQPSELEFQQTDFGVITFDGGVQLWTEPTHEQPDSFLACPVCGSCISGMSLEQREVHTNACLDSIDKREVHINVRHDNIDKDQAKAQGKSEMGECVQVDSSFDLTPVLRWLETLNLSRYASVFIHEEIDWDTLKCLTDEDLNTLGITALGPRRKILHSLQQLEQGMIGVVAENSSNMKTQGIEINGQVEADTSGKKLITDFFILPPNLQRKCSQDPPVSESSGRDKAGGPSNLAVRKRISAQLGGIPEWMCIPGTKFRVDAFQHLRGDCSHWFLTHFHTDHYQGLTRGFRYGHVYCSPITAQLVNARIGIPWERLKALSLNERVDIDGVKVTFIDANHCPGSVMVLFEPPNGKAVLHTGDFRFCEDMARSSVLQACNIDTLMLDTTYCNPQYDFPKQEVVIQFIIDAIQAEAFNPSTLFLIGTYTIGKERIFFEVAKVLRKKIYVSATKLRLLQCMKFSDEDMGWLTTNDQETHIHVVPLWSIASFKRMSYISRHNHGRYNSIVSFSPTGWSFGRGKKRTPGRRWQQGTIIRYEVPYSEHCSFKELRDFVRFINAVNIVPSVHNDSADALVALLLNEEAE